MADVIIISDDDDDGADSPDNNEASSDNDPIGLFQQLAQSLDIKFSNLPSIQTPLLLSEWRKSLNPFRKHGFNAHMENHNTSSFQKYSVNFDDIPDDEEIELLEIEQNILSTPSKETKSSVADEAEEYVFDEMSPNAKEDKMNEKYSPYYLQNFEFIIAHVLENEKHLLNAADLAIVEAFSHLSKCAKMLYVRLFQRKKQVFRTSKVYYPKIDENLNPFFDELVRYGFVVETVNDLESVLNLMSTEELTILCKNLKFGKKSIIKKDNLISQIINFATKQKTFFSKNMKSHVLKQAKEVVGMMVTLDEDIHFFFMLCLTLFSIPIVNYEDILYNKGLHPLFHMLQVNNGSIKYPNYQIDSDTKLFRDRASFISYVKIALLEMDFDLAYEKKSYDTCFEIYQQVRERILIVYHDMDQHKENGTTRFSEPYVLARLGRKCIEILEKRENYNEAIALILVLLAQRFYYPTGNGFLYERLALDYERYIKDLKKAIEAIERGLDDPFVRTGHRLALQERWLRLTKRITKKNLFTVKQISLENITTPKEENIRGQIKESASPSKRAVFVSPSKKRDGSHIYSHVEQFVLNTHLNNGFLNGLHAEGSIVTTLFMLLFWDIVFGYQDNVFISKYQNSPLDIFMDCFYTDRKDAIDSRLENIRNYSEKELRDVLETSFKLYSSCTCLSANFTLFENAKSVADLGVCMGAKALAGICELFAKDFRRRRGGFPDLIMWNIDQKKCKIIEVKGPGDKLSTKQCVWLDILQYLGLDAVVTHVSAIGAKRKSLVFN